MCVNLASARVRFWPLVLPRTYLFVGGAVATGLGWGRARAVSLQGAGLLGLRGARRSDHSRLRPPVTANRSVSAPTSRRAATASTWRSASELAALGGTGLLPDQPAAPQATKEPERGSLDDVDGRRAEDRQVIEHGRGVAGPVERG
jgi:hypothetical protein